jgi:hypothetical protein
LLRGIEPELRAAMVHLEQLLNPPRWPQLH